MQGAAAEQAKAEADDQAARYKVFLEQFHAAMGQQTASARTVKPEPEIATAGDVVKEEGKVKEEAKADVDEDAADDFEFEDALPPKATPDGTHPSGRSHSSLPLMRLCLHVVGA